MLRIEIDVTRVGGRAVLELNKLEIELHIHREGKLALLKYGRRYWFFLSQSLRHLHIRIDRRSWNWHRDYLDKLRRIGPDGHMIGAGK